MSTNMSANITGAPRHHDRSAPSAARSLAGTPSAPGAPAPLDSPTSTASRAALAASKLILWATLGFVALALINTAFGR